MAVIVYVSIFPQLCFICVHMPISGLSSLVQFLYMPATVRQPVCRTEGRSLDLDLDCAGYCKGLCVKEFFSIFLWENADHGEEQDPGSDGLWWKGNSRGRSW